MYRSLRMNDIRALSLGIEFKSFLMALKTAFVANASGRSDLRRSVRTTSVGVIIAYLKVQSNRIYGSGIQIMEVEIDKIELVKALNFYFSK